MLLLLFSGAFESAPAAEIFNIGHALYIKFRDKRIAVEFRDKRINVEFRDKRTQND